MPAKSANCFGYFSISSLPVNQSTLSQTLSTCPLIILWEKKQKQKQKIRNKTNLKLIYSRSVREYPHWRKTATKQRPCSWRLLDRENTHELYVTKLVPVLVFSFAGTPAKQIRMG